MVVLGRDGSIQGFAPQALGERVPQITNGYFYADTGISLLGHFQEYAALYRSQPVVATLVDKIANSGARLDIKVYDVSDPKGRKEQPDSDFAKLLAEPSRRMSAFSFYRWTFSTYEVLGEAYWLKVRDKSGKVVALEPMHPERVAIKRDVEGVVTYIFSIGVASAGILEVPADDVVAFQRYNPDNTMRGLSRLEQLRVTLLNEDAARRANSAFWKNGARPSVVLTHPDSLSRDAMDKISAQFTARHSGADNFGGAVVLEEGMTIVETQLDSEEMQYIESRKLNMQEVCMVFDVPPPVVHILDHATYSNITEQMRSMYRDTMAPRFEDFESVIDFALRAEFYPDGGFEAEFDMTDILRGDFETRATTAAALRQGGIVTGNEARDIIGLEQSADPEMAKVFANSAMVELGTKPPAPGGGDAGGPAPTDHRVPGDELIDGGPKATPPGTVAGDELLGKDKAKPKPVIGKPPPAAKALERAILGEAGRAVKSGKSAAELKQALIDQHMRALEPYFQEQKAAAKRGEFGPKAPARKGLSRKDLQDEFFNEGGFDDSFEPDTYGWDDRLAGLLGTLSKATAIAIGRLVATELGSEDQYDATDIAELLKAESGHAARKINKATFQQLADAYAAAILDQNEEDIAEAGFDPMIDSVYDGLTDGDNPYRLQTIAKTRVKSTSLIASEDAAIDVEAAEEVTKTWQVNNAHPREAHALMDGETVHVGEPFSNGMLGPGDLTNGGVDQVAGCDCTLRYNRPDRKSLGLKYSDDEPRDDHGRWGDGGSGDGEAEDADIRPGTAAIGALGVDPGSISEELQKPAALAVKAMADTPAGITPAVKLALTADIETGGNLGISAGVFNTVYGTFDNHTWDVQVDPAAHDGSDPTAQMAGTVAHELGHAVDYALSDPTSHGVYQRAASAQHEGDPAGTPWGDFFHAVRDAPSSGEWNQQYGARLAAYAHTPTEVFARSYAQYTGLAKPEEDGQFSPSDFAKVAPAVTRILKGEK